MKIQNTNEHRQHNNNETKVYTTSTTTGNTQKQKIEK